jgi:diguanylate cyclase (GGDEF)-like protein
MRMTAPNRESETAAVYGSPAILRPIALAAVLAGCLLAPLLLGPSTAMALNLYLLATVILLGAILLVEWRGSVLYEQRAMLSTGLMLAYVLAMNAILPAYANSWLILIPLLNASMQPNNRKFSYLFLACVAVLTYLQISQSGIELNKLLAAVPQVLVVGVVALVMRILLKRLQQLGLQQLEHGQKDSTTGLLVMSEFMRHLDAEHQRAVEQQSGYALLMIDIDGLHLYNEKYGFEQGERVLAVVADAISRCLRKSDHAARYGGDEFIICAAYADDETAQELSNTIMQNIYNISFSSGRKMHRIVVHMGIALFPDSGKTVADMMNFADQAMYRDKEFRRRTKSGAGSDTGRRQAGIEKN